jgi:hypothetical protein
MAGQSAPALHGTSVGPQNASQDSPPEADKPQKRATVSTSAFSLPLATGLFGIGGALRVLIHRDCGHLKEIPTVRLA